MIWALISPTFSFRRTSCGSLPSTICWRIAGTHLGQRESVLRGQPSGGLVFSHDFRRGLSDHLGVKEGLGLIRFRRSKTAHAPLAAVVRTFSAYLTGLCIRCFFSLMGLAPQPAATSKNWFLSCCSI